MSRGDDVHSGFEVVDDPRGGFVLALVVLLLFGIGVAGAAGYQVVLSEALMSVHAKETQTALSIARAGLRSYIGKQVGIHDDIVTYSIEGGDAVVTARLVSVIDDFESLYLLRSEGVYTDPTFTGSAARRIVYQWAKKREVALNHLAAVTQATGAVLMSSGSELWGDDQASGGECGQTSQDLIGVLTGSGVFADLGGSINGNPNSASYGSYDAVLDSLGIDWSLLTSSGFPVDYKDEWPECSLPADSFTVTRFIGDLSAPENACGRGVLIVTGNLRPLHNFSWEGLVLVGSMTPVIDDDFEIDGMLVAGLDGTTLGTWYFDDHEIHYDRCKAFKAGKRLSHFEAVGSTWWEEM